MVCIRLARCAASCRMTARLSPRGLALGNLHQLGSFGRFSDGHLCGYHSLRHTAGCTHC